MDFPIFHLDFLGNRMLIAMIAVLHVMINHSLAVGAMPLVAALTGLLVEGRAERGPGFVTAAVAELTAEVGGVPRRPDGV